MLQLSNISYRYEKDPLLTDLNMHLSDHEVFCLLGSSGSGKSTLLRIIAGLEKPDAGDVLWNGVSILKIPPHKRNFGLMFQDYALFPNRNVYDNVAFGLEMKKAAPKQVAATIPPLLEQVGLGSFAKRKVTELSGGEQQRVALARALAPKPHLLMLDEPLGALDHNLRVALLSELREILGLNGIPAIYVTHDQEEAFTIADRVGLLHEGKIIQTDSPERIYKFPKSAWAARFLGHHNLLPATAVGENEVEIELKDKRHLLPAALDYPLVPGQKLTMLFKNGKFAPSDERAFSLRGTVTASIYKGTNYEIQVALAPDQSFILAHDEGIPVGSEVELFYAAADLLPLLV